MEISSENTKILINSIEPRSPTNTKDELTSARRSGSVQILGVHTNTDCTFYINAGSLDQTGAGNFSRNMAGHALEKGLLQVKPILWLVFRQNALRRFVLM